MVLKWHLATKEQLNAIIDDSDCPAPLWSRAVDEMLNQYYFDGIIDKAINKVLVPEIMERYHRIVSKDDLMQIGRMEIFQVKSRFRFDKNTDFMLFAFCCVKQKIIKIIRDLEAGKRDNRKVLSYHAHTDKEDEFDIFFKDHKTNVESFVINKVYLEQLLNKLNDNQRLIVHYHLEGYTFAEISGLLKRGNLQSMHESYKRAIQKMRKGA